MNERIKQLAEKSLQTINNISSKGITDQRAFNQVWFEHYNQKFAELIVRECAAICINKNVSNLDLDIIREAGKFTLQDLATKSCGENLSKQIKKHFGVEE